MHFTIISDTHGLHHYLALKEGEALIHAGDFTEHGSEEEALTFIDWLAEQPFEHKIVIAGNHDYCMEGEARHAIEQYFKENGIIYLNDSGVELNGLTIWGSPITPVFFDWAFNRERGAEIKAHWSRVPANTDVLITHGPANGILDQCGEDMSSVGCDDLLRRIQYVKPKLHAFGHIHTSSGVEVKGETTFINAAVLDDFYSIMRMPQTIEII